jgi:radical SAM-linked protein
MALCDAALTATGYEDISLLSLSTGDYSCLAKLLEEMMTRYECDHVAVSLPSIRADVLTPDLMALIRKVRKTGFTIAPEAGSQRLRDVINKNLSEEQVKDAVRDAFGMGWQIIKLYFMIGLPTETMADLEEMVALVDGLRKIRTPGGRYGKINVSVATFIPKPHTPFQWSKQAGLSESREKIDWLKRRMKLPGVQFKWQNPEMSFLEGLMARGDRRIASVIASAFKKGCRFDGWSDHFRFNLWMEAIEEAGIDPAFFLTRIRSPGESLPWSHMKSGVTDAFLEEEWTAAETLKPTGDCRDGLCNQCGVCDFETLKPRTFDRFAGDSHPRPQPPPPRGFRKLDIYFSKIGPARLFGHLEMVNIITRAMKRAGVPVKYTEGFHPKPKIAFLDALPIGMESLHEVMVAEVGKHFGCQSLLRRLNRELPEGLRIIGCTTSAPRKKGGDVASESTYRIRLNQGEFDPHRVREFLESDHHIVERRSKKGRLKKIDMRAMVQKITLLDRHSLTITLSHREGVVIRPAEFLESAMGMEPAAVREARMVRLGPESSPASPTVG